MFTPIKLDSFSAVAAGQTANLVLATGVSYENIYLDSNIAVADIERVKLTLNAETIFDLTGAELQVFDQYDGLYSSFAGPQFLYALPLSFEAAQLRDSRHHAGALVLGAGDNCVIEVKIAAGAVAPTLKAFAETSPFTGKRDAVRQFESYTVPAAAAGKVDFTSILKGAPILRVHINSALVDSVEIIRDQKMIYELDRVQNDYLLTRAGRTPQGSYFHIDPVKSNFPLSDYMATVAQNLNVRLTVSGAGNIPVLVERMTPKVRNWTPTAQTAAKKARGMGRNR